MKYYLLSKSDFESKVTNLEEYMNSHYQLDVAKIITSNDLEYVEKAIEISKEIVANNREGIALIMLDETGGLGFAAAAKIKGMIVAQISDEHSSHMTREHNGSVAISLGANISAQAQINSIVKFFVEEEFAAGRHMVRVDMLDKMA